MRRLQSVPAFNLVRPVSTMAFTAYRLPQLASETAILQCLIPIQDGSIKCPAKNY